MFYFYGRKHRIANKYPKPEYDTIIEPFCGSAAYSMLYFDKNVILNDKDEKIYKTWKYLISVSSEEIMELPLLEKGQSLNNSDFDYLSEEQKYLIGYFLNPGSAVPKKSPGNYCAWNDKNKKILVDNIEKVRHWKIFNGDYRELENIEATWFVDGPYQGNGGQYYRHDNSKLDFKELGEWCKSRKGQVIVCENSEATWLDFKPLVDIKGQRHKTKEVIWTNFSS
jgi:site-specific DNA-adenine methylase